MKVSYRKQEYVMKSLLNVRPRAPALISTAALNCSQLLVSVICRLCRTGRIDSQEILLSLCDLGVHISEEQAERILKRLG